MVVALLTPRLQVFVLHFEWFLHIYFACLTAAGRATAPSLTFWFLNSFANSCDSAGNKSCMWRNLVLGQLIRIQMRFGGGRAANVRHLHCSNMHWNISGIVTLILLHSPFILSRVVPYISVTQLMNRAHLTPCLVSDSTRERRRKMAALHNALSHGWNYFVYCELNVLWRGRKNLQSQTVRPRLPNCSTFLPIEMPFGILSKRTRAGRQIDQHDARR